MISNPHADSRCVVIFFGRYCIARLTLRFIVHCVEVQKKKKKKVFIYLYSGSHWWLLPHVHFATVLLPTTHLFDYTVPHLQPHLYLGSGFGYDIYLHCYCCSHYIIYLFPILVIGSALQFYCYIIQVIQQITATRCRSRLWTPWRRTTATRDSRGGL